MKEIIILTDYKGYFGSKQKSTLYRSGMDIPLLVSLFQQNGVIANMIPLSQVNRPDFIRSHSIFLYTSSEDKNGFYKSYIEDIVFNLEKQNIIVLPCYQYLRAHNNKVAMELLRERYGFEPIKTIRSKVFGTLEELIQDIGSISFPAVIKTASGAMSKGVTKAGNRKELIRKASKISRSKDLRHDLKEWLRSIKYRRHYVRESFHRNKFIVQNMIPGLDNDWKVLVYGNRCYVLYRGNRDHDFRASGSGKFVFRKDIPEGMLDYALSIKSCFNVPHISLDIGFDGKLFHLIEFQFIYFGTTTLEKSPFYFEKVHGKWETHDETSVLEEVYVKSIVDYIAKNNL